MTGFADIFSSDPLLTERMLLVCSREYYESQIKGDHSLVNLIDKDFITDEDDPVILNFWFRNHFGKIPDKLNIVMNVDSHEALLSGLKLGMGLGIATGHLIWEEIQRAMSSRSPQLSRRWSTGFHWFNYRIKYRL